MRCGLIAATAVAAMSVASVSSATSFSETISGATDYYRVYQPDAVFIPGGTYHLDVQTDPNTALRAFSYSPFATKYYSEYAADGSLVASFTQMPAPIVGADGMIGSFGAHGIHRS